jgi:hypothetical protein
MKRFWLGLALVSATFAAACETVPYEERVKAFEDSVNLRFVGRSVDDLVIALGPPVSSYKLSDGREVVQYSLDRTYTTGGGSYTSYETVSRYRTVRQPDGTERRVEERTSVPVTNSSPIQTYNQTCIRRFVVGADKKVQSFNWQGNSCF